MVSSSNANRRLISGEGYLSESLDFALQKPSNYREFLAKFANNGDTKFVGKLETISN